MPDWTSHFAPSLRSLRRTPGFTLASILILAFGLGGAISLFGALHATLLGTPPYPGARRLYQVKVEGSSTMKLGSVSAVPLRELAEATPAVESMGFYTRVWNRTSRLDTPEGRIEIPTAWVDAPLMDLLGHPVHLGSSFSKEHFVDGTGVILTHRFWQERFGGDPSLVGRSLPLFGNVQPILGVLSRSFELPLAPDVQILRPLTAIAPQRRGEYRFTALARLQEGIAPGAVEGRFRQLTDFQNQAHPTYAIKDLYPVLVPLRRAIAARSSQSFYVVCAAAGLLLLVACTNVAALFLNRALRRAGQTSLRLSLGATPLRLFGTHFTESLLVTSAAGVLGLALAAFSGDLLRFWLPGGETLHGLGTAWRQPTVVAFGLGLVLLLALVLAAAPFLKGVRTFQPVREGVQVTTRVRDGLVVAQLALATVLVFGLGLSLRSLWNLLHLPAGFPTEGLVVADLDLRTPQVSCGGIDYAPLLRNLESRPGIRKASIAGGIPTAWSRTPLRLPIGSVSLQNGSLSEINVSNGSMVLQESGDSLAYDFVSHGYVETLGLKVLEGRALVAEDVNQQRKVCLVDRHAAAHLFPAGAIGQKLFLGIETPRLRAGEPLEVVGVVEGFHALSTQAPESPLTLLPESLWPSRRLLVRTTLDRRNLRRELLGALAGHLPDLQVGRIRSLSSLQWEGAQERRQVLYLLAPYGILALLLAALGLGTLSASQVVQRTREIGIRASLGATPGHLFSKVMAAALVRSVLGLALGLAICAGLSRLLESLVYGSGSRDPGAMTGAGLALVASAILAALPSALRAAKLDPSRALRVE